MIYKKKEITFKKVLNTNTKWKDKFPFFFNMYTDGKWMYVIINVGLNRKHEWINCFKKLEEYYKHNI